MPFLPILFVGGGLGYSFVPLQAVASISLVDAGLTAGFHFDLLPSLSVRAFRSGGYFYVLVNDGIWRGGANPVVVGGADFSWAITPAIGIGLGAAYRNYLGLYNDLAVALGMSYRFGGTSGQEAKPVQQIQAQPKPQPLQSTPLPLRVGRRAARGE